MSYKQRVEQGLKSLGLRPTNGNVTNSVSVRREMYPRKLRCEQETWHKTD